MAKSHYNEVYRAWLIGCVGGLIQTGVKPGIVFINNKAACLEIKKLLLDSCSGAKVETVSSDMAKGQRKALADSLRNGTGPDIVISTQVWATGVDIPTIQWIVLDPGLGTAVPTIQSAGRASRLQDGKPGYQVLVPPGKAKERHVRRLQGAGYDIQGPYASVDRDSLAQEYGQELGELKRRAARGDRSWTEKPVGWAQQNKPRRKPPRLPEPSVVRDDGAETNWAVWIVAAILVLLLQSW